MYITNSDIHPHLSLFVKFKKKQYFGINDKHITKQDIGNALKMLYFKHVSITRVYACTH